MEPKPRLWSTVANIWSDCRDRWRTLLIAGFAWRLGSALLLPALYALFFRLAIFGSGQKVLTDLDILYFVTSVIGIFGLLAMGIAITAILALETGTLLTILSQPARTNGFIEAFYQTLKSTKRIIGIAARIVIEAFLWLAPALAIGAATYRWLLSDFDINYYLAERPPSFWLAIAIAGVLIVYVTLVLLKVTSDWFLALPIALFEASELRQVRRLSRERTTDQRWTIRGWIAGWFGATVLASSLSTLIIGAAIWLIEPYWPRSLMGVAVGIGLSLTSLILASVMVNFVSSIALVALLRRLYLQLGGNELNHQSAAEESHQRPSWITPPRLVACVVLVTLAISLLGFTIINGLTIEDKVLVIGHRGSPQSAPGNTLASARAAIEEGADWVEIDVQETADGEVIVFHDSDLMQAANLDLKIWNATAEQIASVDLGSSFRPEFAGEGIPTLAEVLNECRDKAGVVIELKEYGHSVALEERVVEIVERLEMADQTMFMSLDQTSVKKLRALRPGWRVGQLLSVAFGKTSGLEVDFLGVNASFTSRSVVQSSHRAGREVYVWTVDDPVTISSLVSRGVDGIITNVPSVAKVALKERADMPPMMRLLVDLADRYQIASEFPKERKNSEP